MMPSSNTDSSNTTLDAIVPSGPLTTRRTVSSRAKAPDLGTSWRLNRFLARAGFGSRRSTEELILKGSVSVNGSFCRDLAKKVTDDDDVRVNGRQIHPASLRYILLHKPTGYVSTRSDRHAERTIFDLLPTESSTLFHVGRLDKDSEGLLLLTNDGDLAQKLLHPSSGIDKEYEVCLDQPFTPKAAAALKKGTWIEGSVARVESVHQFAPTKIKIVLHQGIKRQIRVMLGQLGFKVKRLLRTRIGPLKLRNLDSGHYRELRPEEVEELRTAATRVKVSSKNAKKIRIQRPPTVGIKMMKKTVSLFCLLIALVLLCVRAQATSPENFQREYIVVSGGPSLIEWEKYKTVPHDHWWANFIRSARNRLAELRTTLGPQAQITWMVYRPSYERRGTRQEKQDLLANIKSVRDKYHLNLLFFNSQREFLNYLNQGQPRDRVKIADFEYFGHSNRACFMFDYSNQIDTGSKAWLHETELEQINPSSFAPHSFIKSWGCHTGESMSARWRKATHQPMIGAIGPTDYSNSDAPGWQPQLCPGGRWNK